MLALLFSVLLAESLAGEAGRPRHASGREQRTAGFLTRGPAPYTDYYEDGFGRVSIEVIDRVSEEAATEGDEARVNAHFSIRGASYEVALDRAGFPAELAKSALIPSFPIEGGVLLDRDIDGNTGIGSYRAPRVRAAIAIWGIGRVSKDGRLLTSSALIQVTALSRGAHADDQTHRLLPEARSEDAEIHVLAENLPRDVEPAGFLQFGFDDVSIEVDGLPVPARAYVDSVPSRGPEEAGRGWTEPGAPVLTFYGSAAVGYPGPPLSPPGSRFRPSGGPLPEALIPTEPPLGALPLQGPFARELSGFPPTPQPLNSLPAAPLPRSEPPLNTQIAPARNLPR